MDRAALYGEDYSEVNTFAVHALESGTVACAISVGGPAVFKRKGDAPVPNEDAVLVIEDGPRVLLAVADGHYGHLASHDLIERLDARLTDAGSEPTCRGVPATMEDLVDELEACAGPPPLAEGDDPDLTPSLDGSESTLTVAVLDRSSNAAFGVSIGDSSILALGLESGVRKLADKSRTYVNPWERDSLAADRMNRFEATVRPGELLVAFSDGVDECRYGKPDESIDEKHLEALLIRRGSSPEAFAEELSALALAGVDGHGGGEDNVCLAVVRV